MILKHGKGGAFHRPGFRVFLANTDTENAQPDTFIPHEIIIILGSGRSGTAYLFRMLGSSMDIGFLGGRPPLRTRRL